MEGGGRIRDWDKEFKMINVVGFGKYKKIVHDSTSIMNDAACKIRYKPCFIFLISLVIQDARYS